MQGAGWGRQCRNKSFVERILCELSGTGDGGRGVRTIGFTEIWGILLCLVGWKRDRLSNFVLVTIKSLLANPKEQLW